MHSIINYFNGYGITESELNDFIQLLQVKTYKAGETLLVPEQTDNYLSFLASGIIRYYVQNKTKETTFDFILPGSFYCHYDSFYTRTPTRFTSEALTDCEVYRIHVTDLHAIYQTCTYAKDLTRIAIEKLMVKKVKRELSLLIDSPQQRYLNLITKKPELIQLIPQKHLATYLGMVPETLSRIRKRIS